MVVFGLTLALFFVACDRDDDGMPDPPAAVIPVDTTAIDSTIRFNYIALGDSYTIGTGLSESTGRFPVQLNEQLDAEENLEAAPVRIIAQNGWTTAQLINAIDNADIDTTYKLVSLLIGVNNQFQNRPIEEYEEQFAILLLKAIELAADDAERVFVVSIPDYGVTPFAENLDSETIATEIDAFNSVSSNIADDYGVSYLNITDISRDAEDVPGMLAPDNLHPSATQYSLWVDSFYKHVKSKLHE